MTSATFNNNNNNNNNNNDAQDANSNGLLPKIRYNLFNTKLFLSNIKRTKTFMILIGVVFFISCPFIGFLALVNSSNPDSIMSDCAMILSYVMFVEAIAFAIILSLYIMSYAHHKKSNIFYTSLPIKKTCFFSTQFISGFAYYFIPLIAIYIPTMLIFVPFGSALGAITLGFFFATLLFLLTYSMSILAANIAGTAFNSIVIFGYFNAYIASFLGLLALFISTFYVFATADFLWHEDIFVRSSPMIYYIYKIFGHFGLYYNNDLFHYISALDIILLFLIIIAFYVFALFLNKFNKAENAGKSIQYKLFERIFRYSVFVLAAMAGGMAFYSAFDNSGAMAFIGIAVAVFITFMFMNIIIRHNIREVFAGIKKLGIFVAAASVIMAVFAADIAGVDKYLPDASSVESVSPGYYSNSAYEYRHTVSEVDDNGNSWANTDSESTFPVITDQAAIEMLNEIFKTAMDLSTNTNNYYYTDSDTYYSNSEHGMFYNRIEYKLKNGKRVTKNMPYVIQFETAQDTRAYGELIDKFLMSDGVRSALFAPALDDNFLAGISSQPSLNIMVKMFTESYTDYRGEYDEYGYYTESKAAGNLVLSQNISMAQCAELLENAEKDIRNIKQLSSWYSDGVNPETVEINISYVENAKLHTHNMIFHSRTGTPEYAEYVNLINYIRSNFTVLEN